MPVARQIDDEDLDEELQGIALQKLPISFMLSKFCFERLKEKIVVKFKLWIFSSWKNSKIFF
jgi:hypothetical protein